MNKQDKTQRDEMQRHEVDEEKASILTHLNALRRMLMISAGTVLAAFVLIFYLCIDWLMSLITGPISARGVELIYTAMSEALMTKFKVALIAAVIVASPVIIWQVWQWDTGRIRKM
mgnify:FL=1